MAELYFYNSLADKVSDEEDAWDCEEQENDLGVSFADLTHPTHQTFLKAALNLKDEVVQATWTQEDFSCRDQNHLYLVIGNCFSLFQIIPADRGKEFKTTCDFSGDKQRSDFFFNLFWEVAQERALAVGPEEGGLGMPYELFYGRAGFLWSALFINKYLGPETIPWRVLGPIVDAVIAGGRAGSSQTLCPLMYQWHGTRYWGAAHGLAGIMHVLLHFPLSREDAADVKGTLRYMIRNRRIPSGNYPSHEGNSRDKFVQWRHGAPGVAMALCKAAQVFPEDPDFHQAAIEAGELQKRLLASYTVMGGVSLNLKLETMLVYLTNGFSEWSNDIFSEWSLTSSLFLRRRTFFEVMRITTEISNWCGCLHAGCVFIPSRIASNDRLNHLDIVAVRASGDPYLRHCVETSIFLAMIGSRENVIIAGLLHDTLDDTSMDYSQLFGIFGKYVADLVQGVSRLSLISQFAHDNNTISNSVEADRLHTMFLAMMDVRVVLIKLADRLHSMRTLGALSLPKQQGIAKETLEIFAPLANRLGIWSWKAELEDLCFKYLNPHKYQELSARLSG
ncbi:hypothetical protein SUGI_0990490 [Cryptomeria japonica]|nr:hypothetical protein SUGI_0990490 [Cryptomeria japonica]